MTMEYTQEGLFQDPLGVRLTLARESKGWSREQAATQLRIPRVIVEAMEREDWPRLGAPIYIRAHLSAYLTLLGLPAALVEGPAAQKPVPQLAAMDSRSRLQGFVERGMRNAVYLVMTGVIVVPVIWLATHYDTRQKLVAAISLEPEAIAVAEPPAAAPVSAVERAPVDKAVESSGLGAFEQALAHAADPRPTDDDVLQPEAVTKPTPVVASLAAFPRSAESVVTTSEASTALTMTFRGDSWVEVVTDDGRRLEWGLVSAGEQRQFAVGQNLRVTLGNAEAVEVHYDGAALDLAPFRSANVARFAVSSSSDVLPVSR